MPIGNASGPASIGSTLLHGLHPIIKHWWWITCQRCPPRCPPSYSIAFPCQMEWSNPWLSEVPLQHPNQGTAVSTCLDPACSRSPLRHGLEDFSDGCCDGSLCMWPSKQPLHPVSYLTASLPESHRNIDPAAVPQLPDLLIRVAPRRFGNCQSWPTGCGLSNRSEAAGRFNVLMPDLGIWRYLMLYGLLIQKSNIPVCGTAQHDRAIIIHN